MALLFSQSTNTRIKNTTAGTYLNGLGSISICCWARNDDPIGNDNGIFTTKNPPDGSDTQIGLRYDASGFAGGGSDLLKASLTTTLGGYVLETESDLQESGTWQHICLTWSNDDILRLFVNGSEVSYTANQSPLMSSIMSDTITGVSLFQVGVGSKGSNTSEGWEGAIDDVRIYGRVLSSEEIFSMYSLSGRDNIQTELLVKYTLSEKTIDATATANDIIDVSGNGYNMDVVVGSPMYTESPYTYNRKTRKKVN